MRLKWVRVIIGVFIISVLTGCNSLPPTRSLIKPPKYSQNESENSDDIKLIAKNFLPEGTKFLYPVHPNGSDAVQLVDIEGDGQYEILITYKGYELSSASGAIILKKENNEWREFWHNRNSLNVLGLDWAKFIDIDDDNVVELLLGWNLGFEVGCILNIISFKGDVPKKVSSIQYNEMDIVNLSGADNEKKPEIALTIKEADQKDIFVPPLILRWVDDGLVPADDVYYIYYRDSIDNLKQSIGMYERNFIDWYNLAEMLIRAKRPLEAIDAVDKALKIISGPYERYRVKLGIYKAEALIYQWKYFEAKYILDSIILRDLNNEVKCTEDEMAAVYLNLGRVYMGLKDYKNARKMFVESNEELKKKYKEGTELFILNSYALKKEMAELEAAEGLKE
ncbi:hypothetical protein ABCY62_14240 [Acetivibrio clariflavus]|uniref:tetratricopeptide repeat protein n=1 Tax=Acetivibrio clariflavus TaxID=288965 RepID=UPI0031F52CDD